MLTKLSIENFKCFEKAEVSFEPLTVLVGPNNAGKSSVLQAIWLFAAAATGRPLEDRFAKGWSPEQCLRHGAESFMVNLAYTHPEFDGVRTHPLKWAPTRMWSQHDLELPDPLATWIQRTATYALAPDVLRADSPRDWPNAPLGHRGEGLAGVLLFLLRENLDRFNELCAALGRAIPGIEEIKITNPPGGWNTAFVEYGAARATPAMQASDGLLLMLGYLAIAHFPQAPSLLLIEEPEDGIHPKALKAVIDLLRGLTVGHYGPPIQVIMSTHSPYLLDFVRPEEVRVFRRLDDGTATCMPLTDTPKLDEWLKDFTVGELWYNVGEERLMHRHA